MSEGEHTIISKIPRERLNQIAGRRLAALSIPVKLGPDRETLEGELPLSPRLTNPATGQPLGRARFAVEGHDLLRFLDPPLAALAPVVFYDCERTAGVEQRVAEALAARMALVQRHAAELRRLGLEPTADPERLAARAVVKTPTHAFELLGAPDGMRVARLAPVGGRPLEIPAGHPRIRLEDHGTGADLGFELARQVPELEAAARDAGRRAAPAQTPAPLEAPPPPRNALTLGQVVRAFGEAAVLGPGAPIEVVQEFHHRDTRYRFVAAQEVGTMFKARLIGPGGDVWSDRFELGNFPGTAQVVSAALGVEATAGAGQEAAGAPAQGGAGELVPSHLLPRPGEVWVMQVVVESQGEDVRYVGTDIDGRPYGAARVLKRSDFEAVFMPHGGGWRLLVVVDQVQGDHVLYRQLDAQRHPLGAPRKMSTSVLVANFVPEAAAF